MEEMTPFNILCRQAGTEPVREEIDPASLGTTASAAMLRIAVQIAAIFVVLVGMVLFPLPIPVGAVLIGIGLAMLVVSSTRVRRWVQTHRRRNSRFDAFVRKAASYLPGNLRRTIESTDPV